MKKILIVSTLITILYSSAFSQDPELEYYKSKEIKTILGRNKAGGGYAAFTAGYSEIDNKQALLFGARFGWLASHSIGVGLGATGFINEFHYEPSAERDVFLAGGYGGLYIEPILFPRSPVHISFPVLFGAGGISYVSKETSNNNLIEDSEAFLMFEPAAELELNLTKHFRLAIGTSYRFPTTFEVGLTDSPGANAQALKGLSYNISLKFGKF